MGDTRARHRGSRVDYIFAADPLSSPSDTADDAQATPTASDARALHTPVKSGDSQPAAATPCLARGEVMGVGGADQSAAEDPSGGQAAAMSAAEDVGRAHSHAATSATEDVDDGTTSHPGRSSGAAAATSDAAKGVASVGSQPQGAMSDRGPGVGNLSGAEPRGAMSDRGPGVENLSGSQPVGAATSDVTPGGERRNGESLLPRPFSEKFTDGDVWESFGGSNHCPVWVDLNLETPLPTGHPLPALAILSTAPKGD
jgi:hypothetical protein